MTNPLFRGQTAAQDAMTTGWLPSRYSDQYVESQEGIKSGALWCYNKFYDGVSLLDFGAQKAVTVFSSAADATVDCLPLSDIVFPVNPINGKRHFVGVSRTVEKFLGDYIIYPLNTLGYSSTSELMPGSQEQIARRVSNVLQRLKDRNTDLLNPPEETPFDYRVKTVIRDEINAFAVPAGGMVVFGQIVKELHGAMVSGEIRETKVEFADGSTVTVDLSGVTLDDALAALMGHEMTHVASRHSMVELSVSIVRSLLLSLGRYALIGYLKAQDKNSEGNKALYEALDKIFAWVQERIEILTMAFRSRQNEYEADATGTYFAKQAQFNPLGALYLQEFLKQKGSFDFLHKHFEFLFSHPYGENRKRAVFASLAEFAPESLRGRLSQWQLADTSAYDAGALSPAYKYSREISRRLG